MTATVWTRCAVAVLLLGAVSARAQSGANPYLSQAKVYFQALEFEKCIKRLTAASKWRDNTREALADIQLYFGLCKLGVLKDDEATEHFERSVSLNNDIALPPLQSPKTKALFDKAKARMSKILGLGPKPVPDKAPAPEPAPVPPKAAVQDTPKAVTLVPPTPLETAPEVTTAPPQGKRWVAPVVLGGASVAAVGLASFFGVQAKNLEGQANAAHFQSDAVQLGQQAKTQALLSNASWGVAGAAATAAVVTYFILN